MTDSNPVSQTTPSEVQNALVRIACMLHDDVTASEFTPFLLRELAEAGLQVTRSPAPVDCIGNDPACPCQDGDACHYRDIPGSPGMTLPKGERVAIALWHRFAPGSSLEWSDETHAAEYRDAARAVLEIANE